MRRLALLIFTLWLLCVALLGTAIWIGQRQPLSQRVLALRLTDCAPPCWIGIMPGKTTMDEAQRIVTDTFKQSPYRLVWATNASPNLRFDLFQSSNDDTPALTVHISRQTGTNQVGLINLIAKKYVDNDIFPSIADLVLLRGMPTCVNTASYNLVYNDESGKAVMVASILSPIHNMNNAPYSIWLAVPYSNSCHTTYNVNIQTWHGFSDRRYWP